MITTTRIEATSKNINIPRTIITILRRFLSCSIATGVSTTDIWTLVTSSLTFLPDGRKESFRLTVLPLRGRFFLLILARLPSPKDHFFHIFISCNFHLLVISFLVLRSRPSSLSEDSREILFIRFYTSFSILFS